MLVAALEDRGAIQRVPQVTGPCRRVENSRRIVHAAVHVRKVVIRRALVHYRIVSHINIKVHVHCFDFAIFRLPPIVSPCWGTIRVWRQSVLRWGRSLNLLSSRPHLVIEVGWPMLTLPLRFETVLPNCLCRLLVILLPAHLGARPLGRGWWISDRLLWLTVQVDADPFHGWFQHSLILVSQFLGVVQRFVCQIFWRAHSLILNRQSVLVTYCQIYIIANFGSGFQWNWMMLHVPLLRRRHCL